MALPSLEPYSSDWDSDDVSLIQPATTSSGPKNWFRLVLLVGSIKINAQIRNPYLIRDFGELHSLPLSQGVHFNVRALPNHGCVAKYPILNNIHNDEELGMSSAVCNFVALELRVLSHEPIRHHPNVVDIVGIGWARAQSTCVPVIYLEYATHGTLADFVRNNTVCPCTKTTLAKNIVDGLRTLHDCGITHGDLKLENVLIFERCDGSVVAKLADFGCASVQVEEGTQLPGGTPPWNAPEWRENIEPSLMHKTDIYSLGLLIWRLTINGENPFENDESQSIEKQKGADLMVQEAIQSVEQHYEKTLLCELSMEKVRFELYLNCVAIPRKVFQHSLHFSPLKRNLDHIARALSAVESYSIDEENMNEANKTALGCADYHISWIGLQDLPNYAKKMFVKNLELASNDSFYNIQQRGRACLELCWAYMDSFGVAQDNDTALDWAVKAARLNYYPAKGLVKRLFDVFQKPIGPDLQGEVIVWLSEAARNRHSAARDDLHKLNYSLAQTADEIWRRFLGCQSLNPEPYSFNNINRLFHRDSLDTGDRKFGKMDGKTDETLWWLSSSRNTLLHAGSTAAVDLFNFEAYLKKYNPDVDARDGSGNTPLLLAMMCGNENHADVLLRFGANASISNEDGETPCHWLITFDNSKRINHFLSRLLRQGADLAALAVKSISFKHEYSIRHGGTPLHWAVQRNNTELVEGLLTHGADPEVVYDGYTPIDIAVLRNFPSVLAKLLGAAQRPVRSIRVATTVADFRTPGFAKEPVAENYVNFAVGSYLLHERLTCLGRDRHARLRETIEVLRAGGLAIETKTSPISIAAVNSSANTETIETLMNMGYPAQLEDIGTFWEDIFIDAMHESDPAVQQFLLRQAIRKSPDGTLSRLKEILLDYVKSLHADASVLQQILDTGIDINYRGEDGKSALVIAITCRNYGIATYLLSKGADVNILQPKEKESSYTNSSVNILYSHISMNTDLALGPLKYLLNPLHQYHDQIPCSIVMPWSRQTALHLACVSGNRPVFKFLLQTFNKKVDLNYRDGEGNTALHAAVYWGRFEFVKALQEAGADIDPQISNTAGLNYRTLMDVCSKSSTPTQTYFHGGRSDKEAREECLVNRLHIWRYLKHCGAQRSQHKLLSMDLHMRFACVAVLEGMMNLLKSCLSRVEILIPIRQQFLDSLLFLAFRFKQIASIRFLIIHGADLKAKSQKGRTVLHYAALKGDVEGVQLLLLKGAHINVFDSLGWNPTSLAYVTQQLGVYNLLKESGGVFLFPKASPRQGPNKSRIENTPRDTRPKDLGMLDHGYNEIETDWEDIDDGDMSDPTVTGNS